MEKSTVERSALVGGYPAQKTGEPNTIACSAWKLRKLNYSCCNLFSDGLASVLHRKIRGKRLFQRERECANLPRRQLLGF